jgi:hypothetical protein
MTASQAGVSPAPKPAPAGSRRAVIVLVAALGVLAAFFLVTKVVMAPASKSTPATTVPVTHGIVRTVAGAATAAAKKLDSSTAADQSQTATTTAPTAPTTTVAPGSAGDTSGPKPDLVRNPFGG